jgi:hypothetical protein
MTRKKLKKISRNDVEKNLVIDLMIKSSTLYKALQHRCIRPHYQEDTVLKTVPPPLTTPFLIREQV